MPEMRLSTSFRELFDRRPRSKTALVRFAGFGALIQVGVVVDLPAVRGVVLAGESGSFWHGLVKGQRHDIVAYHAGMPFAATFGTTERHNHASRRRVAPGFEMVVGKQASKPV